ncbi:MAG: hypothetical protein IT384_23940 [Deltaproteobacteria bacterium]|nr:hypothetical protein [Deltaproteobacteria bacterium]
MIFTGPREPALDPEGLRFRDPERPREPVLDPEGLRFRAAWMMYSA